MKRGNKNQYLLGYRANGIELYKTKLKACGYVVAGLGFACFGFALIPDVLLLVLSPKMVLGGWIASPLGFYLLVLVGIRLNIKRKVADKFRLVKYKKG